MQNMITAKTGRARIRLVTIWSILFGDREAPFDSLLFHRLGDHAADVGVTLVGDDGLRVVIQLLLTVGNVLGQMGLQVLAQRQLLQHLLIPQRA